MFRQGHIWPLCADLRIEDLRFLIIQILSRIRSFILEHLDEQVEA